MNSTAAGAVPDPSDPPASLRRAAAARAGGSTAALFAAVMVAVAIPVATHPLPPLSDYINHLATAHVIDAIATDPDLQRFYRIEWQPIPNLGMELTVPLLHRFMNIYLAGQFFMLAVFALILSGMLALHRALFGRWSAVPLVASPFLYSGVLLVGVMNYLFGIGLALWAFAAWVALRERPWTWRLATSTLLVVAIFFCHLFALGLYATELLAFETHRLWRRGNGPLSLPLLDFAATGVPFLPALLLLFAGPTWESAGIPAYWDVPGKFEGLMLAANIYYPWITYSLLAILVVAALAAWARGALELHPVGWALVVVGGAVYLALPRVLFAAHMADQRLPIALLFMLAACVRIDGADRRVRQGSIGVLVLLLALRLSEVQITWNELSRGPAEALRSVSAIARGARILVAHDDRSKTGLVSDLGLLHIASLATIERSALASTAFTVGGKHVLQVRKEFRPFVDSRDGTPPSIPYFVAAAQGPGEYYFSDWPRHFDNVYILFTHRGSTNPDPPHLAPVNGGEHFQLYRVLPPP